MNTNDAVLPAIESRLSATLDALAADAGLLDGLAAETSEIASQRGSARWDMNTMVSRGVKALANLRLMIAAKESLHPDGGASRGEANEGGGAGEPGAPPS